MPDAMAVQVTIYLNEADQWHHKPLHLAILNYLHDENAYAATAVHCVAGFLGRKRRIGFWGFFFSSILFTPVIGLLYLYFAMPRRSDQTSLAATRR